MVKEVKYTNIRRVLDDLTDHPMLSDLTLEQAVRYTIKFISKHGYTKLYQDKIAPVEIHEFRGLLPCDLISIDQVKDLKSGKCLRSMTDTFGTAALDYRNPNCKDLVNNVQPAVPPSSNCMREEPTFKTQGTVIFTNFPEGIVEIAYKSIPVDEDGFPLLIENETYLDALESFIKFRIFQIKFDQQKISAGVLHEAKQSYALAARLLQQEMTIPSMSEMQSIANMWNTMIPKMREFDNGFKNLGDREYLRKR